ncbi:MAG: 50S ribosome-binding GTPase, partial [Bacteroidales bacterium]|nr:50S ribosome-binding GTPase [Bacteroidales bacterium]
MSRLSELNTGEKGVIVKIQGHGGFRKRIIEMGFLQGKTVEVVHKAPLQDPVEYQILGYHVSLRMKEASQIEVISVEEAEHLAAEHNPVTGNFTPTCIGCKEAGCKFRDSIQKTTEEEDALYRGAREKSKEITVALVGNPNCGKTSLFNKASGSHQRVGNYSGVTVDAVKGKMYYRGYRFTLIDLPGTYSISAYSPEEKYVRHTIINDKPDVILNVVDSSNLERNLFLTTQLIDMNLRMVIALNMYDELEHHGDVLDYKELERLLGVPMIPTVSVSGRGISSLFDTIIDIYEEGDTVSSTDASGKYPNAEISRQTRRGGRQKADKNGDVRGILKHIHINHGSVIERSIDRIREEIYKNP